MNSTTISERTAKVCNMLFLLFTILPMSSESDNGNVFRSAYIIINISNTMKNVSTCMHKRLGILWTKPRDSRARKAGVLAIKNKETNCGNVLKCRTKSRKSKTEGISKDNEPSELIY